MSCPYISFSLGPIGRIIVSIILTVVGVFNILISFGNIISIIVGVIFIGFSIFEIRNSKRNIENRSYDDSEE